MPQLLGSRQRRVARLGHRWIAWVLLAAILVGVGLVRWRLRDVPLERDEGEYAYVGRLLLEGVPPYQSVANHKFPGTYLAYAGLMATFGQTPAGIRIGFLAVNAATIVMVFLLGRRLFHQVGALAAAGAYALLSLSPSVFGTTAHLTHFVVLPVVAGLYLLLRAFDRGTYAPLATAGAVLGFSLVVRQTSLVFVAFGVLCAAAEAWRRGSRRVLLLRAAAVAGGAAAPVLLMMLWLWHAGVLPQFWRWTFTEALAYGSQTSPSDGLMLFLANTPEVIRPNLFIWCGAAAGLALAVWERRPAGLLLAGLLVTSFAAVCSGLLFREHYYVQLLPAIALLFGYALATAWHGSRQPYLRAVALLAVGLALADPVRAQAAVFFLLSPNEVAREIYGPNPFPEAEVVARYLASHTAPDDRIAILGSEPEILFLAHRRSATTVLYTYPLVETHRFARALQEETAREIEAARPPYVVYVGTSTSWMVRTDSDLFIFDWARRFLGQHYRLEGVVDILDDGTEYAWGEAAAAHQVRSANIIRVFRRAPDPG